MESIEQLLELPVIEDARPEVQPESAAPDPLARLDDLSPLALSAGDLAEVPLPAGGELADPLALSGSAVGDVAALFGGDGRGMLDLREQLKPAISFFGTRATGERFVFVVDNSLSMGKGRFETAMDQLVKSVERLSPKQQFYVILFSDSAYRLFHPYPAPGMVLATKQNKEQLKRWLTTVQLCLHTRGEEAVQAALNMHPDAIYILGDGAFTDGTTDMLTAPHSRRTVINTLGMEVNQRGEDHLRAIAAANRGTYRHVSAEPWALQRAQQFPLARTGPAGRSGDWRCPPSKANANQAAGRSRCAERDLE